MSEEKTGAGQQPTVGAAAKDLGLALGRAAGRTAGRAARGTRESIRRNPTADRVYRAGVGVVGTGTVALGVVMIPLPGPGALVALGGLGILSSEFEGAKRARVKAEGVAKSALAKAGEVRDRRRAARAARPAS
ncbi:PGPGW domain-containing protein [Herbiconiux moechotypicola]|uniref:TIGR02611 family protein n=1 Tax=Herbiconiux moechotypicola TaxID=637393 RepID=A0ABN3D8J7_9MICO|nr:PGPGW domain-containing protein [Herbiconiux moechotypicola]MCS5728232.1 PGPGW domain-containing protein [Herbiconiux moechotypicola]